MKRKFTKVMCILILCPIFNYAQVAITKTSAATISNILPFYNSTFIANAPQVSIPFIRPVITEGGLPQNLLLDSTYDDLDDTTYETKPVFDYGRVINTSIGINDGTWQNTTFGKIWCINIVINNALNTALNFGGLTLSSSSKLYILNGEISMLKGPYTNNILPPQGIFGTFPMNGNSCFVFILDSIPNKSPQNSLSIASVVAGVQTLGDEPSNSGSSRVANSCIPSIRCYQDWMTAASSVSRWSNGDGTSCSGTLLNNEKEDGTSYYYSAHHCLPSDLNRLDFASFQFKYWQNGCNTNIDMQWIEFYGATLLNDVGFNDGDAILLRLSSGPGVGDNVVYAGWNRQDSKPLQKESAIIHHPEAGDMRYTKTKSVRDFLWDNDFWKASYSTGVVRPGSSGAALFNENNQVIGTLSRGLSSCFWTFLGDRYGKFNRGWGGMQQYLSPMFNKNSISSFQPNPITITGNNTFGCANSSQQLSVPNLAGCTYTWTTSSNFTVHSGNGGNSVAIYYNGTQASDNGWVNLDINDSKGTIPDGRRATTRLDLHKVVSSSFSGYYTTNIDATQVPLVDGSTKSINVQRGQFVSVVFNVTNTTNISGIKWTCDNSYSNSNTFSIGWNAPQTGYTTLYKTIYLDLTTACGIVRNAYFFNIMSLGWAYTLAVSPNPANNSICVSIAPITDQNTKASSAKSNMNNQNNSKGITRILLYETGNGTFTKKWEYNEIDSKNYNLNISGIPKGNYILKVERDNYSNSTNVLVQ